jgi:hypothetical protein
MSKLGLTALLGIGLFANAAFAQTKPPLPPHVPVDMPSSLRMQYNLWEAEQLYLTLGLGDALRLALHRGGIEFVEDPGLRVMVELVGPEGSPPVSPGLVASMGGELDEPWENSVDGLVPIDRLTDLAAALDPGYSLLLPNKGITEAISQAPGSMNATALRLAGFRGKGVKIALIDYGFEKYDAAQTAKEIPPASQVTTKNYTWSFWQTNGSHGVSTLEILYDFAPEATYFVYYVSSEADLGKAVDNAISKGVHFISLSMAWPNTGWADDTGLPSKAARKAAQAGIPFFTAAGNEALMHYQGAFADATGNNWHDFPNREEIEVAAEAGEELDFYLQWDDVTDPAMDLDMVLYRLDEDNNWVQLKEVSSKNNVFETLDYTPTVTETLYLGIWRKGGSVGTDFEVFGNSNFLTNNVPAGSTQSPVNTNHTNVISVAAVHHTRYVTGALGTPIESYSSRGPTNSGVKAITLSAPTGMTLWSEPLGFNGTSGATPAAAGLAAVLKSDPRSLPLQTILAMQGWAEWLKDWPPAGLDNTYGYGGAFNRDVRTDTIPSGITVDLNSDKREVRVGLYGSESFTVNLVKLEAADPDSPRLSIDGEVCTPKVDGAVSDLNNDGFDDVELKYQLPLSIRIGTRTAIISGIDGADLPYAATFSITIKKSVVVRERPADRVPKIK